MDGLWKAEPVRTFKDYRKCLNRRQFYPFDEIIEDQKRENRYQLIPKFFVSFSNYIPDAE